MIAVITTTRVSHTSAICLFTRSIIWSSGNRNKNKKKLRNYPILRVIWECKKERFIGQLGWKSAVEISRALTLRITISLTRKLNITEPIKKNSQVVVVQIMIPSVKRVIVGFFFRFIGLVEAIDPLQDILKTFREVYSEEVYYFFMHGRGFKMLENSS